VTDVTSGYTYNVIDIEQATHGGWMPYSRLYIFGNTGNLAGGAIRVDVIDQ